MTESPGLEQIHRSALERVEELLRLQAPHLRYDYRPVERYISCHPGPRSPLNGLVITAPEIEGLAQVVVVATQRTLPQGRGGLSTDQRVWVRDMELDYSLSKGFDSLTYELTIIEDPWEGRGHSRDCPVGMHRDDDSEHIAALIGWWSRYPQEFAASPPGPVPQDRIDGLRAVAQAKLACLQGVTPVHQIDRTALADLDPASQEELELDRSNLLPVHLLWNFPRDDRGKLELACTVLLSRYESATSKSPGRRLWLCARGPERRKDPQEVTVRLLSLIGENRVHRWDEARWLWDARAQNMSLEERWGMDDVQRVAECTALLDAGRIVEALALYGIELDRPLAGLLEGIPVQFELRDKTAVWAPRLQEGLRGSAPWLLARAPERSELVQAEWRKGSARRTAASRLRLLELGGQNQQRRPGVFLTPGTNAPRLILDWSRSNARVPAHTWVRPVDYDLVRFGLIERSAIPTLMP